MARRIVEIASFAGVSPATVSRVLNGRAGVSDKTRQSVLTALDVLGYDRPSRLTRDRARMIGLVLPELQNPTYPAFAEVAAGSLARRGFIPVLCTRTDAGVSEVEYVEMLIDQQVSGLIFFGGNHNEAASEHSHYYRLRERRIPAVLVNATFEDLGFPCVSIDDAHAVDHALRHLLSLGHERLALVLGPPDHVPSHRRLNHWLLRGQAEDLVEHTIFSHAGGQAAGERLLDAGATGILCGSDILALGVISAVRKRGLAVPADLSVIGNDGAAFTNYTDPPLTTIRQPLEQMAQTAVNLLVRQIDGERVSPKELLFEPELVVRASTGPAPVLAVSALSVAP